ncbi:MAG: tetratricopeptide repeat protein [Brevinematales bacterium]
MNKTFFLLLFIPLIFFAQSNKAETDAFLLLKKANDSYKLKKFEEAKTNYLNLIKIYPSSKYVPYALYVLSTIETEYPKILEYLFIIEEKYPDFEYWTNSVEKLGEIFYVMGRYDDSLSKYIKITTDSALYMQSLLFANKKEYNTAIEIMNKLLSQTVDNYLVYKTIMLKIKVFFETKKYNEMLPLFQLSAKLINFANDSGARLLFYVGKYYFIRNDIEKNYEKSLYAFSLLKRKFPLSLESSLANNYLAHLKKNKIEKEEIISWLAQAFQEVVDVPYKGEITTTLERQEKKLEKQMDKVEGAIGKSIKTEVLEYVVRIGEYKDLSVANMVAMDIGRQKKDIPIGVFFRDDRYYAEVRGIKDLNVARNYAKEIKSIGYDDAKVIEIYKITEYTE